MAFECVQWIRRGGALLESANLLTALTQTTYTFQGDKLLLEPKAHALRVQHALRAIQERADAAFEPWGMRAPAPALGVDPDEYKRNLLIKAKKLIPGDNELRHVQVRQLPREALSQFENMIYPVAKATAYSADSVPDGQMRAIEEKDSNGLKMIRWIGKVSFVKGMGRPGRRVASFNTSNGPMNASGQFLR